MKNIFCKNKIYSENEINKIAVANGLAIVDCLKDENIISIEKWNDGEGEDCLFEFDRIKEDSFLIRWSEFEN
ncbi:hypothetical protein L6261_02855 [Candidatus Parcubacteria bacterium]|nr:hypothetical protein [Candidatus Parcubacteria bacterium]